MAPRACPRSGSSELGLGSKNAFFGYRAEAPVGLDESTIQSSQSDRVRDRLGHDLRYSRPAGGCQGAQRIAEVARNGHAQAIHTHAISV
jgi:hypothetical protein